MDEQSKIMLPQRQRVLTRREARDLVRAGVLKPTFPHLWTRRPKIVEPRDPVRFPMRVAGEFRMQVRRPDGRVRHDTGWFPNLITNLGLNAAGAGISYSSISVGTGNTAPAFTDTNLVARVATTNTDNGSGYTSNNGTPGDPDWYTSYLLSLRFAQGAAAGNLAEIGVTTLSTPWNCYSRALILDSSGNPTTLTVLGDEFLDVSYNHRWYVSSLDDVNDTITITGSGSHDIVIRPCELDGGGLNLWRPDFMWDAGAASQLRSAYTGAIGSTTGRPAGTAGAASSGSTSSYVSDSHESAFSAAWGLTSGNLAGGIASFAIAFGTGRVSPGSGGSAAGAYQFSVDPVINKTSSQLLTMNFTHAWARRTL
jgi:hypothetical protein